MQSGLDLLRRPPLQYHGAGTQVAFRVVGQGPPLLLIHGFPAHGLSYRNVIGDLQREYACVVVDLVGAGESIWNDDTDFSLPAHARRLKALMQYLGHERYAVVGHDSGGSVARHLALLAPRRVARLAIINSEIPGHRPPWIPLYQRLLALPGSADVIRVLFRLPFFRRSSAGLGGCFWDKRLINDVFHELFVRPIAAERRRASGICRYLAALDWQENDEFAVRHREIACPVCLIWGADDPTFPLIRARELAQQFPHCVGLHVIERAKLFVHEERPDEVNAALLPFLKGNLDFRAEAETTPCREDVKC